MKIDINCDVGEGVANEHLLMPYISSCNIACGGHFGDVKTIDETIGLAIKNNVLIGAHPSFPDKENFGRKTMCISDSELQNSIEDQLDLFVSRMSLVNKKLHHVKPHGALYNLIAVNVTFAELFIKSIQKHIKDAFLYVPYNSIIEKIAINNNIKIKYEAFADRNYNEDLTLVCRSKENAVIINSEEVFQHIFLMIKSAEVKTISGYKKAIKADTICVHGDTKNAIEIVKKISERLKEDGVKFGF